MSTDFVEIIALNTVMGGLSHNFLTFLEGFTVSAASYLP